MNLENLYTVLVPTYNRPALLRGLLSSLGAQGFTGKVVVLDSSTPSNRLLNKAYAEAAGSNVTHIEFPEAITPQRKICAGIDGVTTPYASLCADDDVLFVDGVKKCVAALEQDNSFVGCHGIYLNFDPDGDRIAVGVEYAGPSIDAADLPRRLYQLMARYEAIFYGLFRTEPLRKVLDAAADIEGLFYELFAAQTIMTFGGMRRIDSVYHARRAGLAPTHVLGEPWLLIQARADEMFADYYLYRTRVLGFFAQHGGQAVGASDVNADLLNATHLMYLCAAVPESSIQARKLAEKLGVGVPVAGNSFAKKTPLADFVTAMRIWWRRYIKSWILGETIISRVVDGKKFELQKNKDQFFPPAIAEHLAQYCTEIEARP